jgi:hypothetical protein
MESTEQGRRTRRSFSEQYKVEVVAVDSSGRRNTSTTRSCDGIEKCSTQ